MSDKEKCFIIMPLTVPEHFSDKYTDQSHFQHVLSELISPAVEAAGYEPIPPIARGSKNIHKYIVSNLRDADNLLCDISALNPNVFFELGIRTVINKRIAVIKDDITSLIPFDIGNIFYHEYDHQLLGHKLKDQIPKLSAHIVDCFNGTEQQNDFWQTYGSPDSFEESIRTEQKLEYMNTQLSAIRSDMETRTGGKPYLENGMFVNPIPMGKFETKGIVHNLTWHRRFGTASLIKGILERLNDEDECDDTLTIKASNAVIEIRHKAPLPQEKIDEVMQIATTFMYRIKFYRLP